MGVDAEIPHSWDRETCTCLYSALPETHRIVSLPCSVVRGGDSAYSLLTSLLPLLHESLIGKIRSKRNQILDPRYKFKVSFQC